MANNTANIVAGRPRATGGAYRAALGSTLATDATTALDAAFKTLGYVSDAGVTETIDRTTTQVKAWGSDIVKVLQTDFGVTYQMTLIETLTGEVNKAVHGDANVTATSPASGHGALLAITYKSAPLLKFAYSLEVQDGIAMVRLVLPNAQIVNIGDITYSDGAVVAYPVTIQAFPDSSGINVYKYSDDGLHT